MAGGELGKVYKDGEVIICEGDEGKCMFVIQEGEVSIGSGVRYTTVILDGPDLMRALGEIEIAEFVKHDT